jgi:hypothetical protein
MTKNKKAQPATKNIKRTQRSRQGMGKKGRGESGQEENSAQDHKDQFCAVQWKISEVCRHLWKTCAALYFSDLRFHSGETLRSVPLG